ncbi:MAG: hypothetical protein GWP14_02175 [Actinobacteria bacterium]|nr:hypothetical protein [Actinomycetota bacterium]
MLKRLPVPGVWYCAALLSLAVVFQSSPAQSAAPTSEPGHTGKVIWRADFTDPDMSEWSTGYYSPSGKFKGKRTLRTVNGKLVFSSTFPDPLKNRGYASASYNFHNGGKGFAVAKAPVLEVRMRCLKDAGATLVIDYLTRDGRVLSTGCRIPNGLKVGEWFDLKLNLYSDARISGKEGMQYIRRLAIFLFSAAPGPQSVSLEIERITLREMTEKEWKPIELYAEPLGKFKMQPCPNAENFFGFGFYGVGSSRWGGGLELTLDRVARHWVNFYMPVGRRFGDIMRNGVPENRQARYDPSRSVKENMIVSDVWLENQRKNLDILADYGMKFVVNMQSFTGGPKGDIAVEDMNRRQLEAWADAVTGAFRDVDSILGWYIGDETPTTFLKKYRIAKQLLESRDRSKTAVTLVNGLQPAQVMAPHHQVIVTDNYPILRPNRDDPWEITWWMDEVRRASGDKPHWILLETFIQPKEGLAARPNPVEVRLMSWLATAGGADVVSYFLYNGSPWWFMRYVHRKGLKGGAEWGMVDEYGNDTPLWNEYARFAEKVGPLGQLMAGARVVEQHGLRTSAPIISLQTLNNLPIKGPRSRPAIYLGVLQPRSLDALIVFAVNIDRDNTHQLRIGGTTQVLSGRKLYDLVTLQPVRSEKGGFVFGSLRPGDGHPFVLASPAVFAKVKRSVLAVKARQALRVAELDVRQAERWKIGSQDLRADMAAGERALEQGEPTDALTKAQAVSHRARGRLDQQPIYPQASALLDKAQKDLGRIEILLNLTLLRGSQGEEVKQMAKRVVQLSERFSGLKRQLYFGKKNGLAEGARQLAPQVEQALAEVGEVTGLSVPDPLYPNQPWRHPEWFK